VAVRTKLEITSLPGADHVATVHLRAGAQMDNLCGPYWASILLRANGFQAGQEDVAVAAGTLLPSAGDAETWVPPGETNRVGYGRSILRTDDVDASGTSVAGLVSAVSHLSGDAFRFLPVRGRLGRPIDEEAFEQLADLLEVHPAWQAAPVLNLRTGLLWGTRLSPDEALAYLSGAEVERPKPGWDVGHFVSVAGLVRGDERTMVLLRDSYPSLGWGACHLQPLEAVAAAMRRDDGREGGCLLFVSSADAPEAERELVAAGFDIGAWDNGTPYEGGER
jgi:hypothetical protein